jgi:hypothetical protein
MERRLTTTERTLSRELEPARRRIAVRLIVQTLHGWRHGDPFLRQAAASLERRNALRRQPWRHHTRPSDEPISIMERIRRFEARARAH